MLFVKELNNTEKYIFLTDRPFINRVHSHTYTQLQTLQCYLDIPPPRADAQTELSW